MATVQRYVNTASSAGGDGTTNDTAGATRAYATLSEWEANAGGSATDDYIVDCCGTAADTTQVTVDFSPNITTGSVTIRGNRGDAAGFYTGTAAFSTSHYRLDIGDAGSWVIDLLEANTVVDGIQATFARSSGVVTVIKISVTGGPCTVRKCRVLLGATGATFTGIGTSGGPSGSVTRTIENNLIVGANGRGIQLEIGTHYSPTHNIYHNTVYGSGTGTGIGIYADRGAGTSAPTLNIKGNAVANNAGNDISVVGSLGTVNYDDNATEDFDLGTTGEIDLGTTTDAWTSPGTTAAADFSVKDSSSSLYQVVATVVSEDIVDYTRDGATHDAGAFDLQVAGDEEEALIGSASTSAQTAPAVGFEVAL